MIFPRQLVTGTLLKRYKRFFADVLLDDGREVTAHCVNTGSMKTVFESGRRAALLPNDDPERKLKFTLELIHSGSSWIGVNTSRPNFLVEEAISSGLIPELTGYGTMKREVKYGTNSRIDLLLSEPGKPTCFIEVKNTTYSAETGIAAFPDSVTDRGLKHLVELQEQVRLGNRAVMFYLVNREDCPVWRPADDLDPAYGRELRVAVKNGVELMAWSCNVQPDQLMIIKPVSIQL
ncbi:MAG: DNA/RNA nuclease SfsA [Bacteroidetes bacterium]|nr:DNA/RNA nuclease SfsA [Bacteroidota bacterium]